MEEIISKFAIIHSLSSSHFFIRTSMKIQKFYFLFVICSFSLLAMEQPIINTPHIPSDIWKIIAHKLIEDKSAERAATNFFALARTSRLFAQFSRDPDFSEKLVQDYAQRFSQELDDICPQDPIFAAAYLLHTPGAKQWIKTQYLQDSKNFKIVSDSFFYRLRRKQDQKRSRIRVQNLKKFIQGIFPKIIPPLIHQRLSRIPYSVHFNSLKNYPYKFVKSLLPKTETPPSNRAITKELRTALISSSPLDTIKKLLENGADPDAETALAELPLCLAIAQGNTPALRLLLERGANPNNRSGNPGGHPLYEAQINTNSAISSENIRLLLAAGTTINTRYPNGLTPLMVALGRNGDIQQLLQAGADPNMPSGRSMYQHESAIDYPLGFAINNNKINEVKLLLAAGANTQIKFFYGEPLAEYACTHGQTKIAEILNQHKIQQEDNKNSGKNS